MESFESIRGAAVLFRAVATLGLYACGSSHTDANIDAGDDTDANYTEVCPPFPAIPGPDCTGWRHTGVSLTAVARGTSGPGWHVEQIGGQDVFYITENGAVIDGLDIPYLVKVFADDVTIQRSRIAHGGYYTLVIGDLPSTNRGLHLIDVELDGLQDTENFTIAAMASLDATYTRVDVHGMASSGPRLATNTIIEDSWIHDFVHGPDGHEAGLSSNDAATGIVLRHNHISIDTEGASAPVALYRDFGNPNDVLIEHNRFDGGNYGVMAGIQSSAGDYAPINDIRIVNNVFGRTFHPECGRFGAVAQFSEVNGTGNVFSGNVWGDGAAAADNHGVGDPVQ
jgi:hypothetical protein